MTNFDFAKAVSPVSGAAAAVGLERATAVSFASAVLGGATGATSSSQAAVFQTLMVSA